MIAKMFFVIFLALLRLGAAIDYHAVYTTCLSCSLVSHQRDCKTIVEIWPDERCSTEILLLGNGSTAFKFGYQTAVDCPNSHSPSELSMRQKRGQTIDITLCLECCSGNLCNRKLCALPDSNSTDLACLSGSNVMIWPREISVSYCDGEDLCFARRDFHQHEGRPNQQEPYGSYGCAAKVVCDHLSRELSDSESSGLCQKCCSEDGCNAHICHSPAQNLPETSTAVTDIEPSTTVSTTSATDIEPGATVSTTSATDIEPSTTVSTTSATDIEPSATVSTTSATDIEPSATVSTTSAIGTTNIETFYTDCWDLLNRGGFHQDGVYDIYPEPTRTRLRVRCDMTTDGGGWIILQRRYDGSLNFTRTFEEYKEGFGNVAAEHWLGLQWMHILTSQNTHPVQLRVDLCTFNGDAGYAKYNVFTIAGRDDTYRLSVSGYAGGSLVDGLSWHNRRVFDASGPLFISHKGGWWYLSIGGFFVNLNGGLYNVGTLGIVWYGFPSTATSLRSSDMKIRPVNVTGNPLRPYTCPP